MDCEMVGVGPHQESGLARCSLVDINGDVLYDKFIRPEGQITNYRTRVSGITRQHMEQATPFAVARLEVSEGPFASQVRGGCRHPHTHITHFPGAFPRCQICHLCPQQCKIPCYPCVGSTRVERHLLVSVSHP